MIFVPRSMLALRVHDDVVPVNIVLTPHDLRAPARAGPSESVGLQPRTAGNAKLAVEEHM